ncbi:hypothetical protein [Lignipirellula cremea]|uniref:Uncharacterized protein n=1 Tax=Lignipirellula cremea TaxID=2528010 RepID=A0A518DYR3_9BACT|nr:hypothetical protein [Lignipirellula cremea]QDU96987.1 hypothetical protein Pla8534_48120 [Lignipirellula cremea]
MTFLHRAITPTAEIASAMAAARQNHPGDSLDRLEKLMRTSAPNADYLWLQGKLRATLAEEHFSADLFRRSLESFGDSLAIDPAPLENQAGQFVLPEHPWVFPAYRRLLDACLARHQHWVKRKSFFWEQAWYSTPPMLLAGRIARAIMNAETQEDTLIDGLLPCAMLEPVVPGCPFRQALAALGWQPAKDGFAMVTQFDLDNPHHHAPPDTQGKDQQSWYNLIHDCGLTEEEGATLHTVWCDLDALDFEDLLKELDSTDRFRRAASRFRTRVFGRRLERERYVSDLDNSHRLVRLTAITLIAERLAQMALEYDEAKFLVGLEDLLRVAANDRADVCRCAAAKHLVELTSKWGPETGRKLNASARRLLNDGMRSKHGIVLFAASRVAQRFNLPVPASVEQALGVACSRKSRFGEAFTVWSLVNEKARFVLSRVPAADAGEAWADFQRLFRNADHHHRLDGVGVARNVLVKNPSQGDVLRPILFRCSQIDDSKAVRTAAHEVLSLLADPLRQEGS